MATYNGDQFLRQQLDSLLSQTYSNFEIVISDDQSTDGTIVILKEYAAKDSRIQWSVNPSPSGFITNFARAVSLCNGEIIFLCDQDDVWNNEKISLHVEAYKDQSIRWVYNEARLVDEKGKFIGLLTDISDIYYSKKRRWLLNTIWGTCILGCVTSYRSSLIKNTWPADIHAPGHDSWIQLVIFPAKAFHIPSILQDYRQHDANVFGLRKIVANQSEIIAQNMKYLKSLVKNRHIQRWKRLFLFIVYHVKMARQYWITFFNISP